MKIDLSKGCLVLSLCFFAISGCDAPQRAGETVEGNALAGSDVRVVRDGKVSCYTFLRSISCVTTND